MHVLPASGQGQAHQDALNSGTGCVQAEACSTIVYEVELNIAASAQLLPGLLLLGERHVLSLFNDRDV